VDIKEDFLQFIWKFRLFSPPLKDLDEIVVEVVDPGMHNRDAGPDFFNARIRYDGLLWAGNVEIHKKASEWYQHGHHLDGAFDNVILHIVLEPDCLAKTSKGREIRTVQMEISPGITRRYGLLMSNPELVPCWRNLKSLDQSRMGIWLERLLLERLEERVKKVVSDHVRYRGEWSEVLYVSIARAMGQKVNADPFDMLARSVPLKKIIQFCPDEIAREAILFGQAGMLAVDKDMVAGTGTDGSDEYYQELCRIYRKLKIKLDLQAMDGFLWKFLRLRPDNFPTIRISQLACSLDLYPELFEALVGADDPVDFVQNLEIGASGYWTTHYRFGRKSPARVKKMGKSRLTGLYVNAFLPVLLAYRRMENRSGQVNDLVESLTRIKPEDNRITRMWKSLGREVPDVFSSQALLQLTNKYCKFKSCLSCYVGSRIIQSSAEK
jgi:hypothetical protein